MSWNNKDTNLIFEAYSQKTVNEGKMKQLHAAIADGDSAEQICRDMDLEPTPELLKFIHDLSDKEDGEGHYEDMESCGTMPEDGEYEEYEDEDAEHGDLDKDGKMSDYEKARHHAIQKAMKEDGEYSVPSDHGDTDESDQDYFKKRDKQEAAAAKRQGFNPDESAEDKTGELSDEDLLKKVKGMGTAGDCLIDAAQKRLKDGMSLTAHERDALARDAYGDAEKEIAKESVSYTSRYIV